MTAAELAQAHRRDTAKASLFAFDVGGAATRMR